MSAAPRRVAVVGASLAGLSTARALRAQGYTGEVVVVGNEIHRPYDRPPLSKDFLGANHAQVELSLEGEAEDLDATWHLGVHATGLRPNPAGGATVLLSDDATVEADAVVVATGATARCDLPGVGLPGVHLLRTIDDAVALRADLHKAVRPARPLRSSAADSSAQRWPPRPACSAARSPSSCPTTCRCGALSGPTLTRSPNYTLPTASSFVLTPMSWASVSPTPEGSRYSSTVPTLSTLRPWYLASARLPPSGG